MSILRRSSKGQILVLYTIALPVLVGALGLCCDMAVIYMNWQGMQKAADAAVLSGAGWLNGTDSTGDTKAISTATNYATLNGVLSTEIAGGAPTVSADHKTITITVSRTVPYLFARAIGVLNAPIQVSATAGIEAVDGAGGNHLVPFGFVCPGPPCMAPGTSFALPGDTNIARQSPGNWGGLQFADGQHYGGANYTKAIENGYQGTSPIMVGTTDVSTQTGNDINIHGPAGIADRYNAGSEVPNPSNPSDLADPNDPRVIVIPMVQSFPNGHGTVDVTGFITALIVPEPGGKGYYAVVVSTSDTMTVASLNGPKTGTTKAVLLK